MARPNLYQHRKFLSLCAKLKNKALAIGSLELVWQVAYESGDPLIGDADTVEYAAGWQGEPGKLATALIDSGFIDVTDDGLAIHDLEDHEPDYVKDRRRKERERRAAGIVAREKTRHRNDNSNSIIVTSVEVPQNVPEFHGTPAPTRAPAPAPTHLKDKTNTGASESSKVVGIDGQPVGAPAGYQTEDVHFVAFFNLYPRKVKRAAALRAWVRIPMTAELREKIMSSLAAQCAGKDWRKIINSGDLQYIPYPATWLTDKQWEDETQCKRKRSGF